MSVENDDGFRLAGDNTTPPTSSSYWVVDGLLLAGVYPGDLDPKMHKQKICALLDAGIRLFVDLMEPDETNWAGKPFVPYDALARQLCPDVQCDRFAIRDVSIPPSEQMTLILNAIDESLAGGRPVYVHCLGGIGRTGTVIGCWLLRHGLATHENVLQVLKRLRLTDRERGGRVSPETSEQRAFVLGWMEEKD